MIENLSREYFRLFLEVINLVVLGNATQDGIIL